MFLGNISQIFVFFSIIVFIIFSIVSLYIYKENYSNIVLNTNIGSSKWGLIVDILNHKESWIFYKNYRSHEIIKANEKIFKILVNTKYYDEMWTFILLKDKLYIKNTHLSNSKALTFISKVYLSKSNIKKVAKAISAI